jgi:hypothetical protein
MNIVNIYQYDHILFTGVYDIFRIDEYKGVYGSGVQTGSFADAFYTLYNVDPRHRIDSFEFVRDFDLEDIKYQQVVGTLTDYILYHDTKEVPIVSKKDTYIQLDRISDIFFDCIKILENANEIHMIDSVWACFIYLIDCKYKLFHKKSIYVYCRSYSEFFSSQTRLDHWIILLLP